MPIPVLPGVFLAGTAARVFTALAARAGTDAAIRLTGATLTSASLVESLRIQRELAYRAPKYNAAGNLSGSGFGKEPNSDTGKSGNKQVKRIKGLRKSRSALGFGKRNQPRGPASVKDIVRTGKTSLRRGNRSLAAFIAARYSDKAIAKYNDYAGRLRRSIRLRREVVKIDANTFRVRKHIVKTDTAGNNPYSCTCPDFSQFSDDARTWLGSKAGPFNPCKHMMAVRDRNKGGRWVCSGGVCVLDPLEVAPNGYATQAECEESVCANCSTPGMPTDTWVFLTRYIPFGETEWTTRNIGGTRYNTNATFETELFFSIDNFRLGAYDTNFPGEYPMAIAIGPSPPVAYEINVFNCMTTPILGCTDPLATNFNRVADQDDGSCTY
jgi:hypothetical protein